MNSSKYAYPLLFLCAILTIDLAAQWESLDGPYGGRIGDFDQNEQYQYAATSDGLFRSSDASTWNKLTFVNGRQHDCSFISVLDSVIVASVTDRTHGSSDKQFFLSKNNGDTWLAINMPPATILPRVLLTSYGLYVHDLYQLWFSPDEGQTWAQSAYPGTHADIYSATRVGNSLWLGTHGSIWTATNSDTQWVVIDNLNSDAQIHQLFVQDSVILALAPYHGILFRSTNFGQTWTTHENEIWSLVVYVSFAKLHDTYFAALDHLILQSDDLGATWTPTPSRFYATATEMLTHENSLLFATFYQGVMRSDDLGQSTYSSSHGITAANVTHLVVTDSGVIASCNRHGIFNLIEPGQEWMEDYDDTLFNQFVNDLVRFDTSLFATSFDGGILRYSQSNQAWLSVTGENYPTYSTFYFLEDDLLVLANHGLEQWNAETQTWTDYVFTAGSDYVHPRMVTSNALFAFAAHDDYGVFRKSIPGSTWERILIPDSIATLDYHQIEGLHIVGDKIFLLMVLSFDSQAYRILVSADNGESWQFAETDFPELLFPWWAGLGPIHDVHDVAVTHGDGYTIGVVISGTDNIQWEGFNEGLPTLHINDIAFDNNYIYAATASHGAWRRLISDLLETGITSHEATQAFIVYPNPSTGEFSFHLDLSSDEIGTISFSDFSGKMVASKSQLLHPGLNHVNLNIHQPGAGVLTIQTSTFVAFAKVIIE